MNYNYIKRGDCLELMRELPDNSIDLVVTDPPYKIVSGGCTTKKNAMTGVLKQGAETTKKGSLFSENDIKFSEWVPEVYRILKDGTHCYIMTNGRNLRDLYNVAFNCGFKYQNLLVWDKGNVTPNRYYMNRCEFIIMLRKGKARSINNMGASTLISIPNIIGKKLHPTEKPVELMKVFVENSSNEHEIVLDPFCGVGSTCIATSMLGRKYIGFELDENYFNIAKERIENANPKSD